MIGASGARGGVNLPNLISIGRLILVPFVIVMIAQGEWLAAFVGFAVAGVSDAVDGFIARRFDMRTELGAYIDPLADKALLVSIYATLSIVGVLPGWLVVLVIFRDVMIVMAVILSWLLENPIEIRPLMVSKINTVAQIGLAGLVLFTRALEIDPGRLDDAMIYAVAGLTILSAAAYLRAWMLHMNEDAA